MENNTPESKLDQTVKNTLNNYDATYEAGDWSRMESMLTATPKSTSFQWSYAIKIAVVLVVIAGGYFLFNAIKSPKIQKEEVIKEPVQENVVKVSPKVIVPTPPVKSPAIDPSAVAKEINKESNTPDKIQPTNPVVEKIKAEEKPIVKEEKRKEEKTKEKSAKTDKSNSEENVIKHTPVIMGNEPVFGDMLDSSKGVVGETKEKEETKKAAKARRPTPGWDNFMTPNVNPDSIKKHRAQRDSLKNQ
jgi:hypothetical protein